MKYKIRLDDNSFLIVDKNYILPLFKGKIFSIKKPVLITDFLLDKTKYKNTYLIDKIGTKKFKRSFVIEEADEDLPLGRYKYSQDIRVGDLVMGINNQPRQVEELHTGIDEMFEITIGEEKYIVNGGHILALYDIETKEHLEMPVNVYMHMNDEFKRNCVFMKEEI